MRLSLSPTYYWQQVYSLEEEFDETSRRPASIPKRNPEIWNMKNDKAFQLLLDIDCIIKTKGSLPTQAVSHRRKNDGCVCRSVKLHVCKNSLSRIFQFVKINELYNIYIFPGIACKVEPGKVLYVRWNCSERCQLGLCNHCTVYGSHNPSQIDSSLH